MSLFLFETGRAVVRYLSGVTTVTIGVMDPAEAEARAFPSVTVCGYPIRRGGGGEATWSFEDEYAGVAEDCGDGGGGGGGGEGAVVAYMHRQSIFNMEVGGDDGHVGGQPFCLDHI